MADRISKDQVVVLRVLAIPSESHSWSKAKALERARSLPPPVPAQLVPHTPKLLSSGVHGVHVD